MKKQNNQSSRGIGVIEIIVVIAVVAGSFFAISQLSSMYVSYASDKIDADNALNLAAEGIEGLRTLRDSSWTSNIANKTIGTTYYLTNSASNWAITNTNPGRINGVYDRKILFSRVYRDINDNIASSGTEDINIRKVTVNVSWQENIGTQSVSLDTYLSNFRSN
jgi:type II secretory pathway pseudopilin PulG